MKPDAKNMLYITLSLAQAVFSEFQRKIKFFKNNIDLARAKSEVLLGVFRNVFL